MTSTPVRASGVSPLHATALCAVFFLSGASALIFETLWFRLAGLAFGNGIWASALVLSSFMAGLALGNYLAARRGQGVRRPERLYAVLELVVAATGITLVVSYPTLSDLLAPLFRSLGGNPVVLNALRLTLSFLLLMVPATAMGMTLPMLVKALLAGEPGFGRALGRLYGWNTLGAVAGALLGEMVLIGSFGVIGTSLWAGALNLLAAVGALAVASAGVPSPRGERVPLSGRARRLLAASFIAGGTLLAFEVIWFRFLQLFFPGTTLTFAVMLSIVLAGIGLGGLIAAAWMRRAPRAHGNALIVALASGLIGLLTYALFDLLVEGRTGTRVSTYGLDGVMLFVALMFPMSVLSGVFFTLIGHAAHEELGEETRTAGLVTMANTVGAALGPIVAGFFLIPRLGMERSFQLAALAYGVIALLLLERMAGCRRIVAGGLAVAFTAAAVFFPSGRMERYIDLASAEYRADGSEVVAVREGLLETIQYLRKDFLGQPTYYRLVTNGFSMSGTHAAARRYMKYYVYWPVAVHPGPRDALLISYGTGSTAEALVDTDSLESIVVVDISPDILEMSSVVFPEPGTNPLDDDRVETHVEDGRFFLQTTERRFDLVTSEPPPPKLAGVVNLYTQEYFQLVHDRLRAGGVATYWLPVVQLTEQEAKAIMRAFLNVFGDETTLWTGCGFDWMLVGSRDMSGPVSQEHFSRQWDLPEVRAELRALGFEHPGQLGATFMMGSAELRELTADTPPLTDGYPQRLSARVAPHPESMRRFAEMMNTTRTRQAFTRSPYIRALWPASMRATALEYFAPQTALNRLTSPGRRPGEVDYPTLHELVTASGLQTPVLWAFDSTAAMQDVVANVGPELGGDGRVAFQRGVRALAERDFDGATRLFKQAHAARPSPRSRLAILYTLCLAQRIDEARALVGEKPGWFQVDGRRRAFLEWLAGLWPGVLGESR